jgi:hypothetical protein
VNKTNDISEGREQSHSNSADIHFQEEEHAYQEEIKQHISVNKVKADVPTLCQGSEQFDDTQDFMQI